MPESSFDHELGQLLEYSRAPQTDAFVADVMRGVKREQRVRRVILWAFGLVGAVFGLMGAVMLSDSVTQLFTFSISLPATETMQVVLFAVGAAAFYNWFMNDDLNVSF